MVEALLVAGVALLMTMVTFRDVWLSRFTLIPGDGNDGRLNAFFLEHSWGWISRRAVDSSLWGLPIYFPHGENALAYSDAMVSFGPLYWPWRALGLQPDVSYALWCMSVVAVGAVAGYLLLRLAVGLSPAAAAIGSWLVGASASRIHQISHSQLLPVFYVCAGLAGVVGWVRLERPGPRRASAALAAAALVAQLYGGFYQGFFLALGVAVLGAVALVLRDTRREIWRRLRADWLALLAIAALTALALWPWARHYGAAQSVVGSRAWAEIETMVPRPATWLYMSPGALAYEWTRKAAMFRRLPWYFEHAVGIGLLTTVMMAAAAAINRRRLAVKLVVLSVLVVIVATTMVDGRTLWKPIVEAVPSFGAARAISRVGLLFPIGAAVVIGIWADSRRGRARVAALVLMAACAAEQLAALDSSRPRRAAPLGGGGGAPRRSQCGGVRRQPQLGSRRRDADPPRRHVRGTDHRCADGQRRVGQRSAGLVRPAVGPRAQPDRRASLPRSARELGAKRRRRPQVGAVDTAACDLPESTASRRDAAGS